MDMLVDQKMDLFIEPVWCDTMHCQVFAITDCEGTEMERFITYDEAWAFCEEYDPQ